MNNTEWQHKFLKAGTEYGMGDLSMMINIVSEILSEERNKVLDEVKREVENCLLKQYAGRATNNKNATVWIERDVFKNDISTIIDQLKLK